jgi:general secretion pathway protein I
LSRSTELNNNIAGFTLIEVLVALSIVGIALSSIGGLIASASRGNRSIEAHLADLETARTIMNALPDRDQLAVGHSTGEIAHQAWHVEVSPFMVGTTGPQSKIPWIPQAIIISVRSPTGAAIQISTVRLQRRGGE